MIIKSGSKAIALSLVASLNLCATDNNATRLDATVITTTGFESALKDEVRNVTVITSDEIQQKGYRSLNEVLDKAPGVTSVGQGIDIRGQGNKADTRVKILIDGVSINMLEATTTTTPTWLMSLYDIERIEIIPGGGSVLYGSGTTGGVINIITKQNFKKPYAEISSMIGSYSYKDLNLAVGGSVTEKLSLKGNFKTIDSGGYKHGAKEKSSSVGLGLNYQISDNQNLSITPSYFKMSSVSTDLRTQSQLDENRRATGRVGDKFKYNRKSLNINYNVKISDNFDIHFTPSYQKLEFNLPEGNPYVWDRKLGANLKSRYKYSNGELVFGYEYMQNKAYRDLNVDSGVQHMGPMTIQVLAYHDFHLEKQTHSVFLLNKHNFTDSLSLDTGFRLERALYDIERFSQNTTIRNGGTPIKSTPITITESRDIDNYSLEMAPRFKYSETGSVYVKFERGYVSPTPTQMIDRERPTPPARTGAYRLNGLKTELFNTYELGVRDLVFGQLVNATIFLTDTKDEVVYDGSSSGYDWWYYKNVGKTRRTGLELYTEQNLFENLKLSQSYTYLNAKVRSDSDDGYKKGDRIINTQRNKFVFGIDYEPVKKLNLLADIKYNSNYINGSGIKMPGRTLVDIGVIHKFPKGFSISAGVKNLLNKKYNLSASNYRVGTAWETRYMPAAERNYYVEFKYAY